MKELKSFQNNAPPPPPPLAHTHTSKWVKSPHSSFCIPVTSICCNDRKSSSHNERKAKRKRPKGEATAETQPRVVMLEDAAGPERYIKVFQVKSHNPLSIMWSHDCMIQHVTKLTLSSMLRLAFKLWLMARRLRVTVAAEWRMARRLRVTVAAEWRMAELKKLQPW